MMKSRAAARLCQLLVFLAGGGPAQPAAALEEVRQLVVARINRDRAAAGLKSVVYAAELSAAADQHAEEMLQGEYSSHWSRAGWKPYMRYARAGIRDATAENVAAYWCTGCDFNVPRLRVEALQAHQRFMDEQPPLDGHRQSILDPTHTHVGIGLAFNQNGFRMIELFAARYVELDPLPLAARLNQNFRVSGRVRAKGFELMSISIFYEPLPKPMSLAQLKATYSYGLPDEERIERPSLAGTFRRYTDGTLGTVEMGAGGAFQVPLVFWKQQPGVYTVAVWVRREKAPALIAATWSIFVE
jgi:hypothetical protein